MKQGTEKFVIVSTQRSGTGLMRTTLNNHPEVLCLGETFKIKKPRPFAHELSYSNYLKESKNRKVRHYTFRASVVQEYLDWLYSHRQYKAIGFKLMYTQLSGFSCAQEYAIQNRLKFIHMVRRNNLASLVSRYVVRQTGIPHSEKKINIAPVFVPTWDLLKKLKRIEKENQYWATQMCRTESHITIHYEDLVSDFDETLSYIYEYFGIANVAVETTLQKIGYTRLSESISNYEEVSKFLKSNNYGHLLEET